MYVQRQWRYWICRNIVNKLMSYGSVGIIISRAKRLALVGPILCHCTCIFKAIEAG